MTFSEDIIRKQRDTKYFGLTVLAKKKFKADLDKRLLRYDLDDDIWISRETAKSDRKLELYLSKKKKKYNELCEKEIKKAEKEINISAKTKIPRHNKLLEKLLSLMQYYSRLRDTDEYGQGVCISCWAKIHGTRWHGGHYISRMFKSVCIRIENINLQCPECNFATGPGAGSDPEKAKRVNQNYRINLIKKVWLEMVMDLEYDKSHELTNPRKVSNNTDFIQEQIVTYTDLCKELRKSKLVRS